MYALYIDTHFNIIDIAIFKEDNVLIRKTFDSKKHSENTIPLIEAALNESKINIKELNEIIVITGPGSFTGVRIGVVISKILGYTLNIPIKTITYLEAMSLSLGEKTIGIEDKNGVYVGEFDTKHHLKKDYYYIDNKDRKEKQITLDVEVDLLKVKQYVKNIKPTPVHLLTPLYVKKIEVLK